MRRAVCLLLLAVPAACSAPPPARSTLILWAWERPEDLRFLGLDTAVAAQTGFVSIDGDAAVARGRRYPLVVDRPPDIAVVHLQIAHDRPLAWTPLLRRRVGAAVLHYATVLPTRRVQVDFEVRASERPVLLDVLGDLRRALPPRTSLSMTALASWCDGETWLARAPVDEIVPMLFRMGLGDAAIRTRLATGGDFRERRCRTALGVAVDTPVPRAPPGRRVYLFDARSWTKADYRQARQEVGRWR